MNALFYISVFLEINFHNDSINKRFYDNFVIYVQAFNFVLNLKNPIYLSDSDLRTLLINFEMFT